MINLDINALREEYLGMVYSLSVPISFGLNNPCGKIGDRVKIVSINEVICPLEISWAKRFNLTVVSLRLKVLPRQGCISNPSEITHPVSWGVKHLLGEGPILRKVSPLEALAAIDD